MRKLILPLTVIFITMSSFTSTKNDTVDCDALALEWYEQTLAGGYGQAMATQTYGRVLGQCYLDGGTSSFEATTNVE
ncbi:hypothetical protein ACFO5T_01205 [Dokdonia genika]|uniref:Uncharacterized protein n=1 Tax=Dokdonia genika TaxID=308113 RepID=A0ABV9L4P1_9FLAO